MYEWGGAQFYFIKEKNYNFMGKIKGKSIKLEIKALRALLFRWNIVCL